MNSGVFTIGFSATEQVFATAAEAGLPPLSSGDAPHGRSCSADLKFIAGPENRLAEAASKLVLEGELTQADPARAINPLVLFGPAHCGKSHLARGMAQAWRRRQNSTRGVICLSAREWSSRLLPLKRFLAPEATGSETTDHETEPSNEAPGGGLYEIDLLVVEDLHLLRQTPASMSHFRAVFDELLARGVPMVFTSRMPPEELNNWPTDLRARLTAGLMVPIALPEAATRQAILIALAQMWRIELTSNAARRLAEGLAQPAPALLSSLAKLCGKVSDSRQPITEAIAMRFLQQYKPAKSVTLPEIAKVVLRSYRLKQSELTSTSRRRHIVAARSVLMHVARELTDESYASIGKYCGGRDHTTTLHNCRKITEQLETDHELQQKVQEIIRHLQPTDF